MSARLPAAALSHIERIVSEFPPLTEWQLDRLSTLVGDLQ